MLRSLSVRLSITYALCCLISMTAVLLVSYLFLQSSLRRNFDRVLATEVPEYRALLAAQNLEVLEDALVQEAISEGLDQVFFRVVDSEGNVILETDTTSWSGLTLDRGALQSALAGKLVYSDYHDEERDFSARTAYGPIGDGLVLHLGESLENVHAILRQFRDVFTLATVAFVLCSLVAGVYMAQRALSGVHRITIAASRIAEGDWEHRVPLSRHLDEIDELAAAFNGMVERIQILFRELRDVTDDIAHDLRTPLMRIRGEAELAIREGGGDSQEQEHYGSVLEECDQMLRLINTMLEISQTESGARPLAKEPVDLAAAAEDVCELFRPAAEDKLVQLSCLPRPLAAVSGDPARIKRALAHLVDNAIKYTPTAGAVTVACDGDTRQVRVRVSDTGIGIPEALQSEIFGRFYRVEASRSEPGNGLGLSLARAIVRAHGGDITVANNPEGGATFTVSLPADPSAGFHGRLVMPAAAGNSEW